MGQFKDDKKHEKVRKFGASGDKYKGDWVEDVRTGQGVYIWPNGGRYEWRCS